METLGKVPPVQITPPPLTTAVGKGFTVTVNEAVFLQLVVVFRPSTE